MGLILEQQVMHIQGAADKVFDPIAPGRSDPLQHANMNCLPEERRGRDTQKELFACLNCHAANFLSF